MKNLSLVNFILIMLLLISCVRSLYPLTENRNDIIYQKELLGIWKELKDSSEYIVDSNITAYGKNYKITVIDRKSITEKVDTIKFLAMLVDIKGHYFLDVMPDSSQAGYGLFGDLRIPCHFIIKVFSIEKNSISMSAIDNNALGLLLTNKTITIKHETLKSDDILLTEKPEILQQKLSELEHFPSVYRKDSLIRIK